MVDDWADSGRPVLAVVFPGAASSSESSSHPTSSSAEAAVEGVSGYAKGPTTYIVNSYSPFSRSRRLASAVSTLCLKK